MRYVSSPKDVCGKASIGISGYRHKAPLMARTVKALIFKCGDLTANIAAVCSARSECPPLRLDADEKTIEITV